MVDRSKDTQQRFKIHRENRTTSPNHSHSIEHKVDLNQQQRAQKQMEIALIKKLQEKTLIVGFLKYRGEIKGIRFYDPTKSKFIDVAPWHLSSFQLSKLKLMGIRTLELIRYEAGESAGTVLVEYVTRLEAEGYFRANRMISNDLAEALSTIMNVMEEADYQQLISQIIKEEQSK